MKRGFAFTLLAIGFAALALPNDSEARRYYNRSYYQSYYRSYRNSPTFGIRSPYERTRRPLNAPVSGSRYRTPSVVFVQQQPMMQMMPMMPAMSPSAWPVSYPYYSNPLSPIRVIGPTMPTVIERERVIIERQPAQPRQETRAATTSQTQSYIPSQPSDDENGFVQQLDRAQRLFRDRNYTEAANAYHQAAGLNAENATVKMGQALSLLAVGDYEGAGAALRRSLMLNPKWNEKPVLLATFYGEVNDFNAHLIRLERFVKKSGENVEAKFLLAYGYIVAERLNDATELLAKILEIHPNDLEATTLLGKIAASNL